MPGGTVDQMQRRATATPVGGQEPLIVAHRGAWGQAPQNSAAALESAIAVGCDMVELDVRRTRDGKLVAVHDARVGGVSVARLDHADLRARLRPGQAPLLEELLELAAGRIALDVELKENQDVARIMAELAARVAVDGYVVTSFLDSALSEVRRAAPETRTGLLLGPGRKPRRLASRLEQTRADFIAPHASLARAGVLAWAADRELKSYVWTVNEPRVLQAMLGDARVAAVITDRPAAALLARAAAPACPPGGLRSGQFASGRED